jgi:arylsulfatase A-like enzyme
VVALYDAALRDADAELGGVLAALDAAGASGRTLVIVAADHGELLGQHGLALEHVAPWNDVLHVPLFFAWPGHIVGGARLEGRVQLIDVAPTVLALAGLPRAPGLDGRDLSAALLRGEALPDAPAYAELEARVFSQYRGDEHLLYAPGSAAVPMATSVLRFPERALFDVAADPGELHDLATADPARTAAAIGQLEAERQRWEAAARAGDASPPGQSALEALRQAGYVH